MTATKPREKRDQRTPPPEIEAERDEQLARRRELANVRSEIEAGYHALKGIREAGEKLGAPSKDWLYLEVPIVAESDYPIQLALHAPQWWNAWSREPLRRMYVELLAHIRGLETLARQLEKLPHAEPDETRQDVELRLLLESGTSAREAALIVNRVDTHVLTTQDSDKRGRADRAARKHRAVVAAQLKALREKRRAHRFVVQIHGHSIDDEIARLEQMLANLNSHAKRGHRST